MTTTQQPEALRLADLLESDLCEWPLDEAATELRRLHARVVELENITESAKRGFSAITKRHDDWKWRALEAESQLEAIGAGGVESLRGDKPLTDNQIQAIDDSTHFHESPDWNLRFARAIEKHHGIGA